MEAWTGLTRKSIYGTKKDPGSINGIFSFHKILLL